MGRFVSVEYREWNRLGQPQVVAVDLDLKWQGIASTLVRRAEKFVRGEGGRGLYVDTPVTNEIGRRFYEALGYREAYVVPGLRGHPRDAPARGALRTSRARGDGPAGRLRPAGDARRGVRRQ